METAKSYNLPSSSWRPGKAGHVVWMPESQEWRFQSGPKGPRNRSTEAGEDESAQAVRQSEFNLPLPFCSVQALNGSVVPTHGGEGHLLYYILCTGSPSTRVTLPVSFLLPVQSSWMSSGKPHLTPEIRSESQFCEPPDSLLLWHHHRGNKITGCVIQPLMSTLWFPCQLG